MMKNNKALFALVCAALATLASCQSKPEPEPYPALEQSWAERLQEGHEKWQPPHYINPHEIKPAR